MPVGDTTHLQFAATVFWRGSNEEAKIASSYRS
jgi:hypothetical protein